MNFDEILGRRHSTRDFNDKKVSDEDIKKILESANRSPIANGQYEKSRLTVIRDKNLLDQMLAEFKEKTGKDHNPLYGAGCFILFSSSKDSTARFEDAGCVIENMTLKATELGINSCYIRGMVNSLGPDAEYIKKLNLDEGFFPVSGLCLGYSNKDPDIKENVIKANYIDWQINSL